MLENLHEENNLKIKGSVFIGARNAFLTSGGKVFLTIRNAFPMVRNANIHNALKSSPTKSKVTSFKVIFKGEFNYDRDPC